MTIAEAVATSTHQVNHEAHSTTGKDKINQYKWLITGAPGELVYLPKESLVVDHRYQRNAKNVRVLKLARRWNWLACGVLTVAKRGGKYFVIDGQHRLLAALKRSDISSLPCLVFESVELQSEAVAFRDANRERRPITTFEQWNAELVAKDEATVYAQSLIAAAGRTPSAASSPSTVRCLSAIVSAARTYREELERIWPLVIVLCEGNPLHERVFGSLLYLECNLIDGQSVTERRWSEKLIKVGYAGILDAAARAAAFYSKGGAKVWAIGVMRELNSGCRTRVLSMRGDVSVQ